MSDQLKYGGSAIVSPNSLPTGHNYSEEVIAELKRRMALLHSGGFQPTNEVSALGPQYSVGVGEPQMSPQYAVEVGQPQFEGSTPIGMEMSPDDNAWYDRQAYRGDDIVRDMDEDEMKRKAALASIGGR